jgi:tRNA modification GTPase
VKLIDTAGLRETNEEIEGEGVFRARQAASVADLCLVVADASCGPEEIRWAEDEISKLGSPSMLVVNKIDLDAAVLPPESAVSSRLYVISALEGSGLDRLRDAIAVLLLGSEKDNFDPDQAILLRERHRDLVVRCRKALEGGRDALEQGVSPELVAVDLNEAQRALSELLGRDYGPALLDKIFLTFCIGK